MDKKMTPAAPAPEGSSPLRVTLIGESNGWPIKDTLEVGAKLLVGLFGACYVLGLIVVTIHLRGYGLNSLSLSQLHYVTAGVWVLLPILVLVCFGIFLKFMIDSQGERWAGKTTGQKVKDIALPLIGLIGIFGAVAEYLGRPFGIKLSFMSWAVIPGLGTLAFMMLGAAIYMLMTRDAQRPPVWVGLGFGVFAIGIFMSYVVLFAGHTYKEIPWATGGARPSTVALVITAETRPYLESAGIKFSGGQNRTEPIQLLLVTDKEYVVVINPNEPGERAVAIASDLVKSVLYEK